MVKEVVVFHIDEELRSGRVGVAGARHGNGVAVIGQAIVGFVFQLFTGLFFFHACRHATALHHKAWNDTVKNSFVVMPAFHISQKIGN